MSRRHHTVDLYDYGPEGHQSSRNKRRLGAVLLAVVAVLVVAGGLLVSLLTHISVQWAPLLWALIFVVISYGAFLWVRLTK